MSEAAGTVSWVTDFVARARMKQPLGMAEQVWVGEERLMGEVIGLQADVATIQVYEDTTELRPGDPLFREGRPLSVILGPGLLGQVFDGIQRPLRALEARSGLYIERGISLRPLEAERRWEFEPRVKEGDRVQSGDLLGVVQETSLIEHRLLVPPGLEGRVSHVAPPGSYGVDEVVTTLEDPSGAPHPLDMTRRWEVRRPRPIQQRLSGTVPLITGQRVLDVFFPVAKGGSAAIPGGFGTGKTVLQHSLARWSDADIVIHVGCGERGNEMAEVLEEFPELEDPWSGKPLMERTLLIANTSNMPVAARESSIYTGVTLAEYYRDQGYDVALVADSTSRWAQALREISGRLGEMPVEQGYPAYLPSRLASFYERAGRVRTLGEREGSITIIGAVSPPGGDFSEPVTRHTQRFARCWWALDGELANRRHYPAVSWLKSYSMQIDQVSEWWRERAEEDWRALRHEAIDVLSEESSLQQLVQIVGPEALSDEQQWLLIGARLLREGFLQQNAMSEVDAYAVPEKQARLLEALVRVHREGRRCVARGAPLSRIREAADVAGLIRLKERVPNDQVERIERHRDEVVEALRRVAQEHAGDDTEPEDEQQEGR